MTDEHVEKMMAGAGAMGDDSHGADSMLPRFASRRGSIENAARAEIVANLHRTMQSTVCSGSTLPSPTTEHFDLHAATRLVLASAGVSADDERFANIDGAVTNLVRNSSQLQQLNQVHDVSGCMRVELGKLKGLFQSHNTLLSPDGRDEELAARPALGQVLHLCARGLRRPAADPGGRGGCRRPADQDRPGRVCLCAPGRLALHARRRGRRP